MQDNSIQFEPATERTEVIARYEELRYGTFINFGMWSVNDQPVSKIETGPLPPPEAYHPINLDVDQWLAVFKEAGMRYAVLDVKGWHGFALWDSKYSDYDVAASGNKTDVVAEFVNTCRKYEVAPCFNYGLGVDVAHRREKGMTDDEWYEHANNQIREVLTNYGPITTMWFDGLSWRDFPEQQVRRAYETVKSLQPDCLVVMHAPGGSPLKFWPTDVFQPGQHLPPPKGHNPWMKRDGKTYYIPMEVIGWLTTPGQIVGDQKSTRPLEALLKNYCDVTNCGANLTLVVWPNSEGKLPANQAERLLELGEAINR